MRSGYIQLGERMSARGRFIPLLLDRIPPLRWLLRLLPSGKGLVILVPYAWLLAFFVVPFVIVAKISVSDQATAMPPYTEIVRSVAGGQLSFAGGKQATGTQPAPETAPAAPAATSGDAGDAEQPAIAGGRGGRPLYQAELGQLRLSLQ
jgi:hypothetical protein